MNCLSGTGFKNSIDKEKFLPSGKLSKKSFFDKKFISHIGDMQGKPIEGLKIEDFKINGHLHNSVKEVSPGNYIFD